MALKNLTTKFRSLKFSTDSESPYIVTPLPRGFNDPFTGTTKIKIDASGFSYDFPVRGGALSLINGIEDASRILKFFKDAPKGPLFIAKQVGLQLSNPKIETGKIFGIENTRLYNLGLNTLAQIPVGAFGVHFDRSGLLPVISDQNKYEAVVKQNNRIDNNRLVKLYNDKIVDNNTSLSAKLQDKLDKKIASLDKLDTSAFGKIANKVTSGGFTRTLQGNLDNFKRSLDPKYFIIDSYTGGPGSVYGLGTTTIRRYDFTDKPRRENNVPIIPIDYSNLLGASYMYPYDFNTGIKTDPTSTPDFLTQTKPQTFTSNPSLVILSTSYTYDTLQKQKKASSDGNYVGLVGRDFREVINNQSELGDLKLPESDYLTFNMEKRINTGNPGKPSRSRIKVNDIDETTQDEISMLPLFSETIENDIIKDGVLKGKSTRDLVKFRFEAVNNDNISETVKILFRAFVSNFGDNFGADWNPFRYTGRGENFQNYQGFDRKFSFDLKIVAQSRAEMKPLYQKLNFLMSNLTPDYNQSGFMRAPFMLFTLGNYFFRQPCVINSLSISMDDQTTWEIAMNAPEGGEDKTMSELPMILNANIQLTMIHDFIPQKGPTNPFIQTGIGETESNWLKPSEFSKL